MIKSQDTERKRNFDDNQGPKQCYEFAEMDAKQSQPRWFWSMHMQNFIKYHLFVLKILSGNKIRNDGITDFVCEGYNKANSSETEALILDLHLSILMGLFHAKFMISEMLLILPLLDGDGMFLVEHPTVFLYRN